MFKDPSDYLAEYEVIITGRTDGQTSIYCLHYTGALTQNSCNVDDEQLVQTSLSGINKQKARFLMNPCSQI